MTRALLLASTLLLSGLPSGTASADPVRTDADDQARAEHLLEMSRHLEEMAARLQSKAAEIDPSSVDLGAALDTTMRGARRLEDTVRRRELIDDPEAVRRAAREFQRKLEETDMIETLADTMIALSERVELVESDGGLAVALDGREVASVEADGRDRLTLRAGGKRLTLESE